MSARLLRRCESAVGSRATRIAAAGAALGVAALALGAALGLAAVTLGALAAAWLYLAGIAAGAVAFSAALRCSHARWAEAALPVAEAGAAFFPAALVLLAVLAAAAGSWMPSAAAASSGAWVSRLVRDLLPTALLFWCGRRYLRRAREADGSAATPSAVVYLILYAAVLSLWTIDLVMSLHEWAPSTVIPPYFFIGAFLGAIALVALVESLRGDSPAAGATRHDLGKLLFAMIIMWGYLLWAAYLPVWYGNLPDESGQLLARWTGGWKVVTLATLGAVLAFPFVFLLPERTKRGRKTLALAAGSVLVGLFGEHVLLVLPSLPVRADPLSVLLGACVILGAVGVFVIVGAAAWGATPATRARPGVPPSWP